MSRREAHAGADRPQAEGGRPAAQRRLGASGGVQAPRGRGGDLSSAAESVRGMKADDVKRVKGLEAENATPG
jgi:hypothetical protein